MNGAHAARQSVAAGPRPGLSHPGELRAQDPLPAPCGPPDRARISRLLRAGSFESFRVFELLPGSTDRERRGLAMRRMYRTLAPWSSENPLMFHVRSARPDDLRAAITQAADVGFELLIMTFGSGFNFESRDPAYRAQYKAARRRGPCPRPGAGRLFAAGVARRGDAGRQHPGLAAPVRRDALPRGRDGESTIWPSSGRSSARPVWACWSTTGRIPATAAPRPTIPGMRGWPTRSGSSGGRSPISTNGAAPRACSSTSPTGTSSTGSNKTRDGLPREQLVSAPRRAGDHRAAEHLRRHVDQDAVDGLDVRPADRITTAAARPPRSSRSTPTATITRPAWPISSGAGSRPAIAAPVSTTPTRPGPW